MTIIFVLTLCYESRRNGVVCCLRTSKSKQKLPVPVKKTNDRNCTESATKQPAKDQHNVRSQHGVRCMLTGFLAELVET